MKDEEEATCPSSQCKEGSLLLGIVDGYHEGFEAAVKNYKQFLTSIGVISRR